MKSEIGLWIDHKEAVIVTLTGKTSATTKVRSGMGKHERTSSTGHDHSSEDQRDRRFAGHLNQFYDDVIGRIREAESILILGPGEAKGELEDRLQKEGLRDRVLAVETVDKMTDRQVAARVRLGVSRSSR